jgi:membrane protease YdiL (CAAX protease family)
MNQLTGQIIAFSIFAGAVWGMTKLFRCKPIIPGITNPRKSSLRALVAVACTIAILCLFEILRRLPQVDILKPTGQFGTIGDLLPSFVAFILFLLPASIFIIRAHEPLNSIGISKTNLWQSVVIGFVFVVFMFYIQHGDVAKLQELEHRHGTRLIYFAFIGFEEEILFRGYLQTRLVVWLGKWKGWGLASVIMAIGHFPLRMVIDDKAFGTAFIDSLGLIPVSLFFGFLMLRTKNVLAPGILHWFTNWVSELN